MILSLIVAASENNVIGKAGGLPWHLPDEMKHFKEATTGKPVIMGRKTHESIGGPLPNRRNIVVTHDPNQAFAGCDMASSIEQAIELAAKDGAAEAVIIGGAGIYAAALPFTDRLYFTRVHAQIDGDVLFPEIDWSLWVKTQSQDHPADEKNTLAYTVETWERKSVG